MAIGGASFGGVLPAEWVSAVLAAIDAGLDIASGLHDRLADHPEIAARAKARGVALHDVRGLPSGARLVVGSGRKRRGRRALMVGTDCAVGKKCTALALERDALARGIDATFRATGQTGVLITGGGVAIDAVVDDFLSGVVEDLSPDATPDHWDMFEGHGSLLHPAYAAVTRGSSAITCASVMSRVGPRRCGARPRCRRPGMIADIAVFDPATIADRATIDEPTVPSTGIRAVLVNARFAWRDGVFTPGSGQILQRSRFEPTRTMPLGTAARLVQRWHLAGGIEIAVTAARSATGVVTGRATIVGLESGRSFTLD
jgi:hypothetical protein